MEQNRLGELLGDDQPASTERRVMLELQRALLPVGLPVLPDLNLSAGYRAADLAESAGGDWFDAVGMPGEEIGLVVGDVVGHGATASAVMGQLRAVAAEHLRRGDDLDGVLLALDGFAGSSSSARGSRVCVVILNRRSLAVRYAVRGHPPPLVISGAGEPVYLTAAAGAPLAVAGNAYRLGSATLRPGDTLVLYSDGAVARPGHTIGQGMADLAAAATQAARGHAGSEWLIASAVCALITDESAGLRVGHDDVSVLAATVRTEPPEPLTITVPATPEQLGGVRKRFAGWLTDLRASEDDLVALELSVVEAVTNSIEHAFAGPPGQVRVDATLRRDGRIRVVVSDDGRWKPPLVNPGFRGRGLMMMREFCDEFRLDISPPGTTVTLEKTIQRPVRIHGDPLSRAGTQTDLDVDIQIEAARVVVSLSGMLDSSSVERLHACLLDVERHSTLPLIIVLDQVALLASAGLRILFDHAGRLISADRALRLVVADTSPARDVLAVSGLDQLVEVIPRTPE